MAMYKRYIDPVVVPFYHNQITPVISRPTNAQVIGLKLKFWFSLEPQCRNFLPTTKKIFVSL